MNRIEAARTNGALSHGPVTTEGKATSSKNAMKFGLTAADVVITGESSAEYDALMEAARHEFCPGNARELDLVGEIVANRWRMRRVVQMEQAVILAEIHKIQNDQEAPVSDFETARAMAWAKLADSSAMKQIHRHETRLRRHTEKAVAELKELARNRSQEMNPSDEKLEIAAAAPSVQNEPKVVAVQNEPGRTSVSSNSIAAPTRTSEEFIPTWVSPRSSFVKPTPVKSVQIEPDMTRRAGRAA